MKMRAALAVLFVGSLLFVTLREVAAKKVNCHGTSILHLMQRTRMTGSGVESNAVGAISLNQNKQGQADNQRLAIAASGLTTGTTYELFASLRSDTNLSEVATFTAGTKGRASIAYVKKDNGHGHGGATTLPGALNPISDILLAGGGQQCDADRTISRSDKPRSCPVPDQTLPQQRRGRSGCSSFASHPCHGAVCPIPPDRDRSDLKHGLFPERQ
jgi:hypothetical protein